MSKLDRIIARVTEEYAQGMRLRCDYCGKVSEVQDEGRGPLLCCDRPMVVMGTYAPQMPQLESGFQNYPKGWSGDSVKKFGKTLSKNMKGGVKSKGFFDKCVKKMTGKVDNPEGFCASVKDETYDSTHWRGKDKSAADVRKDTKQHKMKKVHEGANHAVEKLLEYEEAYFITQCDKENDRIEDKLLCLKKAYILCGANKVCQQRIDRFYDALTGNFEGSGEAPLQTACHKPNVTLGLPASKIEESKKKSDNVIQKEFLSWFRKKKVAANDNETAGSIQTKFLKWNIILGYPPDKQEQLKFIQSKVRVGERHWPHIIQILLKKYDSLNIRKLITKEQFKQHLIPMSIQVYFGNHYGGFKLYIGTDKLYKAMGNHMIYFEFDQKDKMSPKYHAEG